MRALSLCGGLHFDASYPDPTVGNDEALVRVTVAGVCGTDLELERGYKAFDGVPGHEFVGVVEACASLPEMVGRRVVAQINTYCAECPTCRAGYVTHCPARGAIGIFGRNGAFADRVAVPARNLHLVPDSVPDERAVFAEPLAAACRILDQVQLGPGARVVVVGDGRLGLLCAQVIAMSGAQVTALGRHPKKLAILSARGIAVARSAAEMVAGVDVVVEATGSPGGIAQAVDLVRPCGTVVLKTTCTSTETPVDLTSIVVKEVCIIGSRCGPIDRALDLLKQDAIDVASLVHARYPLEQGVNAFEKTATRGTLKVLVDVS